MAFRPQSSSSSANSNLGQQLGDEHAWERGYERTWEVIQEDEHGALQLQVSQEQRKRRAKLCYPAVHIETA